MLPASCASLTDYPQWSVVKRIRNHANKHIQTIHEYFFILSFRLADTDWILWIIFWNTLRNWEKIAVLFKMLKCGNIKLTISTICRRKFEHYLLHTFVCSGRSTDTSCHTGGRSMLQDRVGHHRSHLCILAHIDTSHWCGSTCCCSYSDTSLHSQHHKYQLDTRLGTCSHQDTQWYPWSPLKNGGGGLIKNLNYRPSYDWITAAWRAFHVDILTLEDSEVITIFLHVCLVVIIAFLIGIMAGVIPSKEGQ